MKKNNFRAKIKEHNDRVRQEVKKLLENSAYCPALHRYLCADLLPGLDRIIFRYETELIFNMNILRNSLKELPVDCAKAEMNLTVYSGISSNLYQDTVSLRDDLRLAVRGRFRRRNSQTANISREKLAEWIKKLGAIK